MIITKLEIDEINRVILDLYKQIEELTEKINSLSGETNASSN